MNLNYENYLRVLVERAKKAQEALDDWQKDGKDDILLSEMSYFIGYCLALEGLLDKEENK